MSALIIIITAIIIIIIIGQRDRMVASQVAPDAGDRVRWLPPPPSPLTLYAGQTSKGLRGVRVVPGCKIDL